jgi:hypothetical protein
VSAEWTISLTRDEAFVLTDYLHRWSETEDQSFADEAERVALDNLLALLESADDWHGVREGLCRAGRCRSDASAARVVACASVPE